MLCLFFSFTGFYTVDVIARVAFGLNTNCQTEKNNKFVENVNKTFDNVNDTFNPMLIVFCEC